ncbi:hypothetical protein V8C42DRAFT_338242 [Trichoderma barbatum]
MSKHNQDPRFIASVASKRRCSARVGAQLVNDSLCDQASSLPLVPETYQAPLLSNEQLNDIPESGAQYQQNITNRGNGTSQSNSQSIQDQPCKAEEAGCLSYSNDIRYNAADSMSRHYDSLYPILQDMSQSFSPPLGKEPLTRPPLGYMQFASTNDMQWPETTSMSCSPEKPVGLQSTYMQGMDFNLSPTDQAWPERAAWPITQTYYRNLAKPSKHTHGEKDMSCVINNLTQLEKRLRNHTRQQLTEIKCSFHDSPSSIPYPE